ncbi:MAG: hypothetical protein ABL998_02860, partial [Planctomycetota bacterium]
PVTEIEIRDPDPPSGEPAPVEAAAESPYKNLLVPLVVVPAMIVMVLVAVVMLFTSMTGKEDTPRENLQRLLDGGFNERKQAAFNLVRQVIDARRARAEGVAAEWDIDESFLPELRAAREAVGTLESAQDVPIPLVLSSLLAQLGDPEGVAQLAEMTALGDELDPEREYRMYAAMTLGAIGDELPEPEREAAARTLIGLLASEDAGMVLVAIAGLQNLPASGTVPALVGMLASASLELRGSAALSLATLGEKGGAAVLRELLTPATYAAERDSDARRWPAARVSESRVKALAALAAMGELTGAELTGLLTDGDAAVRTQALALQAEWAE